MSKKIIKQKEVYNELAWTWGKYVTPPARPCPGLIRIWEKIVREISEKAKNAKALILGSTPELRDLVLKYNFESFACDINSKMLNAMDQLIKHKNNPKNNKIITNWLKMNFPKESFDLILGHQALEQILTKKDLKKLLNKLKIFLKPDGFFLINEVVKERKKPEITGEKWVEWFTKYKKRKICECELHHLLKYTSDWNPYPKSPSIVGTAALYRKIRQLYKQKKVPKSFYQFWEKVLGPKDKQVLIFLRKDFENLLKQYFQLLPIKQCHDFYFCRYMPSYLGRPK